MLLLERRQLCPYVRLSTSKHAAEQYELFDLNLYRLAEIGHDLYCLSLNHIRENTFFSLLQKLYQTSYRSAACKFCWWFLFGLVEYRSNYAHLTASHKHSF